MKKENPGLAKILVFACILSAVFAMLPAAGMQQKATFINLFRDMGLRPMSGKEAMTRDMCRKNQVSYPQLKEAEEKEKAWGKELGQELPPALMPYLQSGQLVDLVGMSASQYYPRKVQDGLVLPKGSHLRLTPCPATTIFRLTQPSALQE